MFPNHPNFCQCCQKVLWFSWKLLKADVQQCLRIEKFSIKVKIINKWNMCMQCSLWIRSNRPGWSSTGLDLNITDTWPVWDILLYSIIEFNSIIGYILYYYYVICFKISYEYLVQVIGNSVLVPAKSGAISERRYALT